MSRRVRTSLIPFLLVGTSLALVAPVAARGIRRQTEADRAMTPAASVVAAHIIGFESDPDGIHPDPFTSKDDPTVHFRDTRGEELEIFDYGEQSNGRGLAVQEEDWSGLEIRFDVPMRRFLFWYGNDDPNFTQAGDRVTVKAWRFRQLVGRGSFLMNRNDLLDQAIEYTGPPAITRVEILYTRGGEPFEAIEIVDDIEVAPVCDIRGGSGDDALAGNARANGICGRGGADRIIGRGGNDMLRGDGGSDRLNGQAGRDLLIGGGGDDTLRSQDGVYGNDTIYGGPGDDTCIADAGDTLYQCETEIRA
jgi:hypothetical protein